MPADINIFDPINAAIIDDIKKELRLQGHYLTGALEASMHPKKIHDAGTTTLSASALGYLEDLETGIPSYNITMDPARIAGLTRYVELRFGYSGKRAAQAAVAIIRKQQKEGMPTKNSYAFSKTGFRTEAVQDAFNDNQPKFINMLDDVTFKSLDDHFHETKSGTI